MTYSPGQATDGHTWIGKLKEHNRSENDLNFEFTPVSKHWCNGRGQKSSYVEGPEYLYHFSSA